MGDESRVLTRIARQPPSTTRKSCGTEDSLIDKLHVSGESKPAGGGIVTVGAIIAVLLGIWCIPICIYGAVGVITGQKMVAGLLGGMWGYMAVVGTYELVRRKGNWQRGRKYSDHHLLAGTVAVSTGLMISGAMQETMPVLAIVPALSAIKQANDGHDTKLLSRIHIAVLAAGVGIGIWFYTDGFIGKNLLDKIAAMP